MNFLLVIFLICVVIYSCVSWLLPTLLAWLFLRKYHIKLKIGRIAVPKLILKDVSLSKDRYSVHINEVSFQSSCFNSEINKLVSVVIRGVEVTNNVEEKRSVVVETILKPLLSKQNSVTKDDDTAGKAWSLGQELDAVVQEKLLDFRNKKLPPSLIMFAQFMAIHIFDASITIHTTSPYHLRASASEVHADGSAGGPARALVFSTKVVEGTAAVLAAGATVGEAACSFLVEGTVKADGPLNVEKIHASISETRLSFQDELFHMMNKDKKPRKTYIHTDEANQNQVATILHRLSPIIPKIFSLRIDATKVTCADKITNTNFEISLQGLQVNSRFSAASVIVHESGYEVSGLPQVYVAFQMDQYQLRADEEQILYLNKLKLDAKLEKGVLNLYLIISTLNITYVHKKVLRWYTITRERIKKAKPLDIQESTEENAAPPAWLSLVFSVCVVQGCAELRGARAVAALPDRSAAAGCAGLKVKLDQMLDTREEVYQSAMARMVVGGRQWSAELLVDGGWAGGAGASRRHHAWGGATLSVALVKWGSHGPRDSKVEAMMDCLRIEWSESIARTVLSVWACAQEIFPRASEKPPPAQGDSPSNTTVNVALSHINLFFIIDETMCIMTRVDAVTVERSVGKAGAVVSGLKLVDMVPYKGNVHCQRSDEIPTSFFYVRLARIEQIPSKDKNPSLLDFQFLEIADAKWSANLHLKILYFIRAFREFLQDFRGRKGESDVGVVEEKRARDWRVSFKTETNLLLLLSENNDMMFATDDMTISYSNSTGLSLSWSKVTLVLNGTEIAAVSGYRQRRVRTDPDVTLERSAGDGFLLDSNRIWLVTIESFRIIFPYKHNFAGAVQGDFVTLFKWLKIVHGIKKKPFTLESPLPSDLHIQIEELLIEMSDDPFEVKLRDNYELLEDEYKESQKRRTMLDAKVQQLCKPHLFLPAGKVEELYAALRQKDAQIYVQRSRAAPAPRTRLLALSMRRLEVLALADPSMHGTARALHKLRAIDADSPWPEEGLEFSTLWCRWVSVRCDNWQVALRDFPQPLLRLEALKFWGTLLGAEAVPPPRATRTVKVDQGSPWGTMNIDRSMMPLKFYYDLCCEMDDLTYAFGPCWEPVIAQCNLAFEQVSPASADPSPPLAWWDRARLTLHGRVTLRARRLACLLHVSLDPYNTTEEMELAWTDAVLDWTNGKVCLVGALAVPVRTASKYDDCRVLVAPALRLAAKLRWQCVADPRDHHAVAPCAPTRLPEYSSNQEHDSYRAFRSQGLDVHLTLETKANEAEALGPVILLYGSTLRWFESLKFILSGITRPTRRGRIFNNVRPRKPQLSRHYRNVSVSVTLHNLQVYYWSSSSLQRGVEVWGGRVTCGARHRLALTPVPGELRRRPRAVWAALYTNCDINAAHIWLNTRPSHLPPAQQFEGSNGGPGAAVEKSYCLSVRRVSYGREAAGVGVGTGGAATPTHRLAVHDLRGAWTKLNRDLAFALIDTYIKTQQLKKNLSTKALKEEEQPNTSPKHQRDTDVISPPPTSAQGGSSTGGGGGMLAALVAEAGGDAPVVFSDELAGDPEPHPHPPPPARHLLDDDNSHTACLIELVNSQVVLKGCETRGYVVVCAARAEVRQRVRRAPAAAAWSGALHDMQYYATVSAAAAPDHHHLPGNIQWVGVEEIAGSGALRELVGAGRAAGGVLGSTVGGAGAAGGGVQLQRIVSRCACEFHYVSQDAPPEAPATPSFDAPAPMPYDCFTLMHHDLDVCTNSLQYAMLLDVINNVVLHVEPERRRTLERRARVRFQMQLRQEQDHKQLIHKLQTQVREALARLRRLEKEYYLKNRSITDNDPVALAELKALDDQVNECKECVWSLGEELEAMVWAWVSVRRSPPAPRQPHAPPHRHNEICFKSARWRLTDADGQLGIADLLLTNFLYTKTSRSDDSVEHQLEVGYVRVTNLLPNEPFPEVLAPADMCPRGAVCRRAALRVFCRDRPPVGGIAVKEHFEVNIVPIRIGLTKKFFNTMLKFCFPERDPDTMEEGEDDGSSTSSGSSGLVSTGSKKTKKKNKDSNSNFYVKRDKKDKDDVEKMKERAEKNKLFIYIKIPEVPVRVSYKGSKEKNLEDVRDLPLVLPTLEYHNVTWTWLDLLLATKTDTRRVILSQAIRQKLQLHRRAAAAPEPLEEDKARLLLGERTVIENKSQKKSTPSVFKFSKS